MRINNLKKNKIIKEEPKEIKSPNRFDKNKFKEIFVIIDSSEFNYKNKIGEFKLLTLNTCLIKVKIIQLVKYMLKNF